jgi:lactoylglutathione lyase
MKLTYVMKFVSNMDDAVQFYRDTLGLPLKSQSPGWSEFATGSTVLALNPASERNAPGTVELGFSVDDLKAFHSAMAAKGVTFLMAPTDQEFGSLAQFLDSEGSACSVSQEQEGERPFTRTAKKRPYLKPLGTLPVKWRAR